MSNAAARRRATRPATHTSGVRRRVGARAETAPLILVVDDAEDTRDLYGEFLVVAGLRVAMAVDGEHALLKIFALMPDVVVMDLSMPTIDGWEATHQIKTHPRTRHIPVIALTGHVTPELLQRARDAGADTVLTKPCLPETLLEEIERFLRR